MSAAVIHANNRIFPDQTDRFAVTQVPSKTTRFVMSTFSVFCRSHRHGVVNTDNTDLPMLSLPLLL